VRSGTYPWAPRGILEGCGERNWKLMKSGLHSIAMAGRKMASKALPLGLKTKSHATEHHRTWKVVFLFPFFFANASGGVRRRGDPYPRTALTAIRKLRKLRTRFCREKRRALHAAGQSSAVCGLRFIAPSWEYSRWPARILNSFR